MRKARVRFFFQHSEFHIYRVVDTLELIQGHGFRPLWRTKSL